MAVKKATTAKKAPAKKTTTRKASKLAVKGDKMVCEVCGLAVVVDDEGDVGVAEILCCEQPMKPKKAKAKAKVAAKK